MNASATIRMFRVSVVLVLAVLAVGALSAQEAEATKNNGTNKLSISQRVKNFERDCDVLGGEVDVSYSYEGEDLVAANVSCSGGDLDRVNCSYHRRHDFVLHRAEADHTWDDNDPSNGLPAGNAIVEDPEAVDASRVGVGRGWDSRCC